MVLPQTLPIPAEKAIASFDFVDLIDGTGYVTYFGMRGDNGENFITTSNLLFSEIMVSLLQNNTVTTTDTKKFDYDFDITFNAPRNIKGKLYANIPIGMSTTDDVDRDVNYYAKVIAKHFDGSTETTLATGTSVVIVEPAMRQTGVAFSSNVMLCVADITTLKHFKIDETLRLTVEGWFQATAGGSETMHLHLGHDPRNRVYTIF